MLRRALNHPRRPAMLGGLGIAVSVLAIGALGIVAWRTDWQTFTAPLEKLQAGPFGIAVGLGLTVEVVKTLRWQVLLGAPVAWLPRLLSLLFTGRLLTALAQLRAGDVWRVT